MPDIFGNHKIDRTLSKHSKMGSYSQYQRMGDEWYDENSLGPALRRLITNKKTLAIFFLIGLLLFVLVARLFNLQVMNGKRYRSIAEGNRIRTQEIKADRGLMFDIAGQQLVENLPDFYLSVVPAELTGDEDKLETIFDKLETIFGDEVIQRIRQVAEKRDTYFKSEVIAEHLSLDKVISFRIACSDCSGVYVKNRSKRRYLNPNELSHLIGYLGLINEQELEKYPDKYSYDDYLRKSGLELYYEDVLAGDKGYQRVEVDSRGRQRQLVDQVLPKIGDSLELTLDFDLQDKVYKTLEESLANLETNRAAVIVMNPNNGEILSLVSYPSYDNNDFVSGISMEKYQELIDNDDNPLFSRAISGEYPPGSTIKPLIALAALEEGVVSEWTKFSSTGGLRINQWYFPDWRYGGHGMTDIYHAIADSVNTYFYYIGGGYENFEGLGVDRMRRYLEEEFSLGKPTGIDLYGERSGFIPSREWKEEFKGENWYVGDTYHLSIGQGDILVTPLQVASFTSMIASGGKIYQPRLVNAFVDPETGYRSQLDNKLLKEVDIDPKNIRIIQAAMRETVKYGSGVSLSSLPFTSAGKTGTAQVGGDKENHAWYTGFAPYEDPEVVITVLVENGGGGDKVAVPIAKEILRWYFFNKD